MTDQVGGISIILILFLQWSAHCVLAFLLSLVSSLTLLIPGRSRVLILFPLERKDVKTHYQGEGEELGSVYMLVKTKN